MYSVTSSLFHQNKESRGSLKYTHVLLYHTIPHVIHVTAQKIDTRTHAPTSSPLRKDTNDRIRTMRERFSVALPHWLAVTNVPRMEQPHLLTHLCVHLSAVSWRSASLRRALGCSRQREALREAADSWPPPPPSEGWCCCPEKHTHIHTHLIATSYDKTQPFDWHEIKSFHYCSAHCMCTLSSRTTLGSLSSDQRMSYCQMFSRF